MSLTACTVLSFLFLLLPSCASQDKLVVGKPLSPGDVIVSSDGTFALGFFNSSSSTPAKLYLGIWYYGIPKLTVVWIANRDTPIISATGRSSSSAPTLALTNTSNLVLSDADGGGVWSTNVNAGAVAVGSSQQPGAAGTAATLTNTGNLEIRSPNGTMLCQSFDHPTDTFLPGMKVRASRGDRAGDRFVSWKTLWRSGAWTGYRVATEYVASISTVVSFAVVDDAYMSFSVSLGAPRMRYVMSYSGELVLRSWNRTTLEWDDIDVWPPYDCSRYGYCGPFGYCDNTGAAAPACRCLDGFEPTSAEEWGNGRFSQGCRRKEALRCGDGDGDGFLALPAMKAPDRFVVVGNRSLDECAAECSRNCSCVAYAYAKRSSSANGDLTRCLVWVGELVDTEKKNSNVVGTEILYLRLAGLEKKGTNSLQQNMFTNSQ
jgi:hypothetical protein